MFGANTFARPFSLTKIMGTISRGLNIANQVIPIYEQAKPMISNARKVMGAIREFAHSDPLPAKRTPNISEANKKTTLNLTSNVANPVFFQ